MGAAESASLPWSMEDIDFSRIELRKVRDDEALFFVLAAASFVETGSDLYAHNLVTYYQDDADASAWLDTHWEKEELQHGRALRAYVEHVWPEFDWQTAYDCFFDEYSKTCTLEAFEPSKGLEMAARCIVETGTATLYGSINSYTDEPVLKKLTGNIRSDEVRHYKYFYRYFCKYNALEKNGRSAVLGALTRRLVEIRNDDSDAALRHVIAGRCPDHPDKVGKLREVNAQTRALVQAHLPLEMSVKMFLKPLNFAPWARKSIQYPLARLAQYLVLR